jgi:hypothetical protein
MTLWKWSTTAANNDVADASINLRENQAPSTYNNAMRAAMAAVAKYRDDVSGSLTTGGTSTAYAVTTNQVFTSLIDGLKVVVTMHATNGASPTFAPDGLSAKPIQAFSGTAIPTGALGIGSIQELTYDSIADAWIVSGYDATALTSANSPDLAAIETLAGTSGALKKTAPNTWALDDGTTAIIFEKDNNSTVLPTGVMGDTQVPFDCTITGVTVLGDVAGSAVIDIWKDAYAAYPPTVADTIVAAAKPTLSSATKYNDTTLTGWTTAIAAGDTLRFNLESVVSFTRLTIILRVKRF